MEHPGLPPKLDDYPTREEWKVAFQAWRDAKKLWEAAQ